MAYVGRDRHMQREWGGETRKERQTIECITRPVTAVGKRSVIALRKFWEPAQNTYPLAYPRGEQLGAHPPTPTVPCLRLLLTD